MDKDKIIRDLKKFIDPDRVIDDELIIRLYSKNAIYMEGGAIALVFPKSTYEVSELVKYAYKNSIKLYPQGSSSEIVGSSTPDYNGIIINFQMMNRIKDINIVDSYTTVEPGVRLHELNQELSRYGYMFPVDPASIKSATVGGAINSGSGGMMGAKYGTMKDWVLELEIVVPDEYGSILRIGSKTMKSRQGYDLVRLIVGSEGTLAIVTEATLKIIPIPENVATIAGFFKNLNNLMNAVVEIKKNRINVLSMEFVDDKTVKISIDVLGSRIRGEGHFLVTSVEISPEATERVLRNLKDIYEKCGAENIYIARSQDETEKLGLYDIRRNYYPASVKLASESRRDPESRMIVYVEDISVPPSQLTKAIQLIRGLEVKYGIPMTLGGHISDGNIHPVMWVEESDREGVSKLNTMIKELMRIGIELGGTMSSEHGIGTTKKEGLRMELEWKGSLKALEYMKKIKEVFDPKNILNPGKLFE